ncbi:peptidase [Staphylococcus delphini]|nr:peptidase [Staphylococcus delphini]
MNLKEVKKMDKVAPKFKNEIKNDTHILTLNGVVASDDFDDTISSKFVEESLKNTNKNIVIKLASGGGDAFEGINIYNYLKGLDNHITVEITSIAASAASIIAMAADKVVMHTGANMMIHEASTFAFGNKSDIKKTLNALESVDASLVDIYYNKTGIDKETLSEMISNETWMTADEAIKQKFADEKYSKKEVTNMDKGRLVASLKEQQKLLAQMISNVSEEETSDKPESTDTLEERVVKIEDNLKIIKSRLDGLEKDKSGEDEPPQQQPQNKFNRFAF